MECKLCDTLKSLKASLKVYNRKVFGLLDFKIQKCVEDLDGWNVRVKVDHLIVEELVERIKFFHEIWELLRCNDSMLFQHSRLS